MITTVAAADDPDHLALHCDSVPVIDLHHLSQSELYSLSLSSDSNRCDNDVVIPKINRSVFNESVGSRKQTYSRLRLHRRTPHLRPSLTHTSNNNINDPDQSENSEIIRMLKQLCNSNPNFHDLDQIEEQNNMPELLNFETLGMKRKRGRPRKHENVVFIRPPSAKRLRYNTIKKEVVYDDDDKDREIVNDKGVMVNVVTLAGLEDPYGPEIGRRTVGMLNEDELLGFLRSLNGQWGSRRRKRRVVDANEFGDVLPKGWKLSLCIKKKEGRIWLFCRRYLSPSGRQFVSCKEISTYLISVIGKENVDKQNHVNINRSDNVAMKEASINAADLGLQEDIKRDGPVDHPSSSLSPSPSPSPSSPPGPPVSTNYEEQLTLDAMDVQVGDDVKIDYIGSHLNYEVEKTKPSLELGCDPVLVTAGDNVVAKTDAARAGEESESNIEEIVHDLNIVSLCKQNEHTNVDKNNFIEESCVNEVSRTNQAPDVAVYQSKLVSDESNRKPETSGEIHVKIVDNKSDCNLGRGMNSESFSLSPFPNDLTANVSGVGKDGINVCATDPVLNQDDVSETGVKYVDSVHEKSECILNEQVGSDGGGGVKGILGTAASVGELDPADSESVLSNKASVREETGFGANMDMHINNTSDKLISEKEKLVDESSSGFFLGRFGLDKDGEAMVKKLSTKSTCDPVKAVNNENIVSVDNSAHGTYNNVNKVSSGIASSRLDDQFNIGANAFGSYSASGMEGVTAFQEENQSLMSHISFSTIEEPMMQVNSESNLRSGGEQPSNKSEEPKLDDLHLFGNNKAKPNESEDDLDFNTKSSLEFCSLVPSENEQAFGFQDCLFAREMEECKEESSERGLLNHFSDDIFENKIYSTPLNGLKFNEDRDISCNELSLAFGKSHVPSKIEEAFDVHTNLSMVNSSMVEDPKAGDGSVGELFNLSDNIKTSSFQNVWEGIKSDEFRNFGNKFTTGYGSNHGQTEEEVVPSGMWRTGEGSQMRSGLSNPSHAQLPSPSSFHSFNIMSEKVGDGQFRLDERYNEGFRISGLRSGRPEPVEFSFLTGRSQHNPHPLQADSRVFSYNPGMEQQFDSSFWLEKNTMMPNPAGRNQMTAVCAWCRNEFHLQPSIHSGTQDGIGSLCPSCSAGMSGHVNIL